MNTKTFLITFFLITLSIPAFAQKEAHHPADHQHGSEIWHRFLVEGDYGAGQEGAVASWDLDGWTGTDENKLWLKSEGQRSDGKLEQAEFWALYSRNIDEFWDVQAGIRHDTQPQSTNYFVVGIEGLAPFFVETEAHLFISDEGDLTARLRREHDLLLTQRLIFQPYVEINLSAQDVPEQEIGAGFTEGEIGIQTRYEITRKFAPYVDFRYERKFGETSSIVEGEGEGNDDFIAAIGLRLIF